MNAGTNELNIDSLQQFAYSVEKAAEKLEQLAAQVKTTVVLPAAKSTTPEMIAKSEYLHEKIQKKETISTIVLKDIDICDEIGHPSVEGTRAAITQIHTAKDGSLIMQDCEEEVVFPMKYRKVQTVFKVGCRGCDSLEYTPTLCKSCVDKAKVVDVTQLEARIRTLREQMFPAVDEDIVMMENKGQKRFTSNYQDPHTHL